MLNLNKEQNAIIEKDYKRLKYEDTLYTITQTNINNKFGEFTAVPLFFALYKKDFALVKKFLELGADPNVHFIDSHTPLDIVITQESESKFSTYKSETIILLLEMGANPNHYIIDTKESLLHYAIKNSAKELFDALLRNEQTNINMPSHYNYSSYVPLLPLANISIHKSLHTPLCLSILLPTDLSDYFAFELLSKQEIDINTSNDTKDTPLHLAVKHDKIDIVKRLLELNVDLNKRNNDGYSPLDRAFSSYYLSKQYDICLQLLSHPEIDLTSCYTVKCSLIQNRHTPKYVIDKLKETCFSQLSRALSQTNTSEVEEKKSINAITELTKLYFLCNYVDFRYYSHDISDRIVALKEFLVLIDLALTHNKLPALNMMLSMTPYNQCIVEKVLEGVRGLASEQSYALSLERVLSTEEKYQELVYYIETPDITRLDRILLPISHYIDSKEYLELLEFGAKYTMKSEDSGPASFLPAFTKRLEKSNNPLKYDILHNLYNEALAIDNVCAHKNIINTIFRSLYKDLDNKMRELGKNINRNLRTKAPSAVHINPYDVRTRKFISYVTSKARGIKVDERSLKR